MADSRCSCGQGNGNANMRETVCIDTMRVLDSCRDRDCYEDVRVYLTPTGQELIDRTTTVRTVDAKILATSIVVDDVPFNRGFYQITARFYIGLKFEACVGVGNPECFKGLVILEKSVVLYGGEGSVHIFRSSETCGFCSSACACEGSTNMPIAVVETVTPIVLSTKVVGADCHCNCCCAYNPCGNCNEENALPREVSCYFREGVAGDTEGCNRLVVSIGMFSVVRLERPAQYLISASEYAVPDKECTPVGEEDACSLFRSMAFPINEFYPPSLGEKRSHK